MIFKRNKKEEYVRPIRKPSSLEIQSQNCPGLIRIYLLDLPKKEEYVIEDGYIKFKDCYPEIYKIELLKEQGVALEKSVHNVNLDYKINVVRQIVKFHIPEFGKTQSDILDWMSLRNFWCITEDRNNNFKVFGEQYGMVVNKFCGSTGKSFDDQNQGFNINLMAIEPVLALSIKPEEFVKFVK
jgi:hypothetical protein